MSFTILLLSLILSLFSFGNAIITPNDFDDKQVQGMWMTTDFAFLPGGEMLITTKNGQIYIMRNPLALDSPKDLVLDLASKICTNGERGVNSILVDGNFDANRYVYVYYTWNLNNDCGTDTPTAPVNRLSRFRLKDDFHFDEGSEIKLFQTDAVIKQYHNGGGIVWGKDGNIWLTTGDGGEREHNFENAAGQRLDNLRAKLVRVTPSGGIPSDNPFQGPNSVRCSDTGKTSLGKECQEIFALGLRNPWSMSVDPDKDYTRVLITDVGGSAWEEIDESGVGYEKANYGFPIREGPCPLAKTENCDNEPAHFTSPFYFYIHIPSDEEGKKDEGACTAGDFVPFDSGWPTEYRGSFIYADFVFGWLYIMNDSGGSDCLSCNPPTSRFTAEEFVNGNLVTRIHFGPDDGGKKALYYATHGGNNRGPGIRKVSFTGNSNRGPEAKISTDIYYGPVGMKVSFDGSGSEDPDGDTLSYSWDFDENGITDSTSPNPSHTFNTAGIVTVTLTVDDQKGLSDSASVKIYVGNSPPKPQIIAPAAGTLFSVGDVYTLVGSATDDEDGTLPDSALEWMVDKHHASHTHPYLAWTRGNNVSIDPAPIPEDFIAATNSFLRVYLKATDSDGLSATISEDIMPYKVNLEFTSTPSGMELILDGYSVTTPYTAVTWANHNIKVEAPDQGMYVFESWSDGSSQTHFVNVSPEPKSYEAVFSMTELVPVMMSSSPALSSDDGPMAVDGLPGVFLEQLNSGSLVVKGSSGILWSSTPGSTTGVYRTNLQTDGNLITRDSNNEVFWKSQNAGGTISGACGTAFLALSSSSNTIGIYCGTFNAVTDTLWVAQIDGSLDAPTSSPITPPTPGPTFMPTTTPISPPVGPSTSAPIAPMVSPTSFPTNFPDPMPTPAPTSKPTPRPTVAELVTLMTSSSPALSSDEDPLEADGLPNVYLEQLNNGILEVWGPNGVLWESSPTNPTTDTYETNLQSDGNLLTRNSKDETVWKSQLDGGSVSSSCGTAFLALNTTADTLGIYCGSTTAVTDTLWVTNVAGDLATPDPTAAPSGAPTPAPTMSPVVETSEFPTISPTLRSETSTPSPSSAAPPLSMICLWLFPLIAMAALK